MVGVIFLPQNNSLQCVSSGDHKTTQKMAASVHYDFAEKKKL